MTDDDFNYSVGSLASRVRDLCDIPNRLDKVQFATLALAMADISLVSSGQDETLIDARADEMSERAADAVLCIWREVHGDDA